MRPSRFFFMTALTLVGLGFLADKSATVRKLPGVGKLA